MRVRFVDLVRQNKSLKNELFPVIEEVISEADFNMGPRLDKFEKDFAKFCSKKYAVGVNSGTDALLLSLMAYGIGKGDEVITVPNSYFSTTNTIINVGAIPIFVDVYPDRYTINIDLIEEKITKRTRAIIPVHLFGRAADMLPIIKIAKKYKLKIIEDACQAHGAGYNGKIVPISETGAFSFFPGKNLGCFGDGGAIVTDNKKLADKVKYLRNDGSYQKYEHPMFGIKSRLDTIQAAILSVKLRHLNKWNRQRFMHARTYGKLLEGMSQIKVPDIKNSVGHVFHLYVIECERRDALRDYLSKKGIETNIHYPTPIPKQKAMTSYNLSKEDYAVTYKASSRILSLPMFPELENDEIKYITDSIKEFYV